MQKTICGNWGERVSIRQTLLFNDSYLHYDFIQELNNLWCIFSDDSVEDNIKDIQLHEASRSIVESMEVGLEKKLTFNYADNPKQIKTNKDDNFILCCVSGGKDSLAVVLYYIKKGYKVQLYTLAGINKGYPEEYRAAIKLADKLGLPIYVDEIKVCGKKYYTEHPLKNQIIAGCAVAYCLNNNLPVNIAFGDYKEETEDKSNFRVNWSDNFNLWEKFNTFINVFVENASVQIPFNKESEALEVLFDNFDLVPLYQSCLMMVRDRESLRQKNQKKYNIKLLENRCGSCYKCCLEYIYFCDRGKFEYNRDFYKHCLEILKKKYVDYTGPKQVGNIKTLEDVHKAYFNDLPSLFFNDKTLDTKQRSDSVDLYTKEEDCKVIKQELF